MSVSPDCGTRSESRSPSPEGHSRHHRPQSRIRAGRLDLRESARRPNCESRVARRVSFDGREPLHGGEGPDAVGPLRTGVGANRDLRALLPEASLLRRATFRNQLPDELAASSKDTGEMIRSSVRSEVTRALAYRRLGTTQRGTATPTTGLRATRHSVPLAGSTNPRASRWPTPRPGSPPIRRVPKIDDDHNPTTR